MFDILQAYLAEFTYAGIFLILLMCGLGLPIPEDIPVLVSGYLIYLGTINAWAALAVNLTGILLGDLFLYSFGYWLGPRAAEIGFLNLLMTPRRMRRVERFFSRHGRKTIFFGRFLAGLRAPMFLAAGMARMPVRVFLFMDVSAALLTVPTFMFAAYYFGDQLDAVRRVIGTTQHTLLLLVALAIAWMAARHLLNRRKPREIKTAG